MEEIADIRMWLQQVDCERYENIFVEKRIALDLLPFLNDEDLHRIGVEEGPARCRILAEVERLQENIRLQTMLTSSLEVPKSEGLSKSPGSNSNGNGGAVERKLAGLYHEIPMRELEIEPEPIGKGAFGVVYKGQWRGATVAVKRLSVYLNEQRVEEFRQEAALLQKVHEWPTDRR